MALVRKRVMFERRVAAQVNGIFLTGLKDTGSKELGAEIEARIKAEGLQPMIHRFLDRFPILLAAHPLDVAFAFVQNTGEEIIRTKEDDDDPR